jgi:ComF family protein
MANESLPRFETAAPPAAPIALRLARSAGAGLASATARLTDLLVPPSCVSCRVPLARQDALCAACWQEVDFIRPPLCDRLGIPLPYDTGGPTVSAAALANPPAFDRARAVARYDGVMRKLVHGLKYADRHEGVGLLGRWLAGAAAELVRDCDVIVPVPLNRWKLWQRRFNQAAVLAHALGAETGLPVDVTALVRSRRTASQVGLTANQRRRNVQGAFGVRETARANVAGRSILLIDDVITTGATAEACTRALRRAGAARVDVAALAIVVDGVTSAA